MIALDILPKKTFNCEPFGLMFMIDSDGESWTCNYYTHYSHKRDDRFPIIKGESIEDCANKMLEFIEKNIPALLTQSPPNKEK